MSALMYLWMLIGATVEVVPRTRKILKMLDPTTFPTARSTSFLVAAMIEVTSSGREVPIAITVAEIKNSLMFSCIAIVTAPSTTHLPPKYRASRPPNMKMKLL